MENIEKQPALSYFSPSGKFWILMLLFTLSLIIFSLLAALVMIPFSHIHSLNDLGKIADYNDPNVITGLKIAQTISAIGTFIIPAFIFSRLVSNNALEFLRINQTPKLKSLLLVVLIMLTSLPLINWMAEWNSKMDLPDFLSDIEEWMKNAEEQAKELTEAFLKMSGLTDLFINLFVIAFLAAFSEELMFRGAIQNVLTNWIKNKHIAIWLTACIFSAFHFQFYGFIPRMVLGALLGYLFMWSGSLWLSIFAHFLNNATAVIVQYLIERKVIPDELENAGSTDGMLFVLPGIFIVASLLLFLYRLEKRSILTSTPKPYHPFLEE